MLGFRKKRCTFWSSFTLLCDRSNGRVFLIFLQQLFHWLLGGSSLVPGYSFVIASAFRAVHSGVASIDTFPPASLLGSTFHFHRVRQLPVQSILYTLVLKLKWSLEKNSFSFILKSNITFLEASPQSCGMRLSGGQRRCACFQIRQKYITVNSLYSGHCRDLELVSSVARVRNNGSLFRTNVCNLFLPRIYLLSVLSGCPQGESWL